MLATSLARIAKSFESWLLDIRHDISLLDAEPYMTVSFPNKKTYLLLGTKVHSSSNTDVLLGKNEKDTDISKVGGHL